MLYNHSDQAPPRPQAKPEAPRTGIFDLQVPQNAKDDKLTINRADVRRDPINWPARECSIVAVSPHDVSERELSIDATCTPERVVLKRKPRGWRNGRYVRVTCQLK